MKDAPAGSPPVPSGLGAGWPRWLRQAAIAALCFTALIVYARFVDHIYPLENWLARRLFVLWGWLAVLHLACLGMGLRITVGWLRLRAHATAETLLFGIAAGVVAWVLAMYLLGALHLYRTPILYLVPIAFLLAGAAPLRGLWRRRRDVPAELRGGTLASREPAVLGRAVVAFGTLCLGLMYLQVFSPAALNYDSVWCHLTVAEAYAREGGIVPFPADYAKNVPQLTPLLHLWGFLVPGLDQPALRWMFALHDEFALFLWTLVGVVAVVGWIVASPRRARASWAAFFLFPGLFVYDSNLGGAADHVLAFFALPVLLAAVRLGEQPTRRRAILFGIVAGGALLTKYQAVYLLFPAIGLLALSWLRHGARAWRGHARGLAGGLAGGRTWRELVTVPAIALATLAAVAAPHFLRNVIFHRNPVYPFMQDLFTATHPRMADGAYLVSHVFTDRNWQPRGTLAAKLRAALSLFFTFSFKPHYYYEFHHNVPSFGSLFTLLLPVVPLLGRQPRLWRVLACASGAIFLWAMTFLVDRNLQTFLPMLVATTAGVVMLAWDRGWGARVGVSALVLFQVVWGGDALFNSGRERLRSAVELIGSGLAGSASTRLDAFQPYLSLGRAVPPDATILLRGTHGQLGIDRRILLDWAGFQGLIDYRTVRSVRELDALYRSVGITHIARVFGQGVGSSKQEDVLVSLFLSREATVVGTFGGLEVFAMPVAPPVPRPPGPVILLGVPGYPDGAYGIAKLGSFEGLPELPHAAPLPDLPVPADPARWPVFFRAAMAAMVGNGAAVPAELLAALGRYQQRLRIGPGSLQLYAP